MKSFNWEDFKNGKVAVNCDTKEKAKDFLKECDKQKIKWPSGENASDQTIWKAYKNQTVYGCFLGVLVYKSVIYFKNIDITIIEWEIDKMDNKIKELTFKEVIANIKEGEVWESGQSCFQLKEISCLEGGINFKFEGVFVDETDSRINVDTGISNWQTFKLQRKQYTFEEAFKAYEEGKEIEGISHKYKKNHNADKYFFKDAGVWVENFSGFSADEIRGKWYIND